MKKNFWLLLAAAFMTLTPACTDPNEEGGNDDPTPDEATELKLLPAGDYEFPAEGGTKSIMVTSNKAWTVESDQEWCAVEADGETKFVITVEALEEGDETPAPATVTVTADDVEKSLKISQKEFVAGLELSIEFSNTTYTGTDFTITPNDDKAPYVVYTFPAFQYDDLSDDELMSAIIEIEGSLDDAAVTGEFSTTTEDVPATDYIVVAFGWQDNAVNGEFNKFEYSTEASANSTCSFTGAVSEIATTTATYTVTPADENVTYVVAWAPNTAEWTQADMNQVMGEFVQQNIAFLDSDLRVHGTTIHNMAKLTHSTPYTVFVAVTDQYGDVVGDVTAMNPFTTATPEFADGLENWFGTWSVTSTKSKIDGGALTINDCIITNGETDNQLYLYGWDISANRFYAPVVAEFDENTGGWTVQNEVAYVTDYDMGGKVGDIKHVGHYYFTSYAKYYFISGDYPVLTATPGADGKSGTVTTFAVTVGEAEETLTDGNVKLSFWTTDGSDEIYSFYADENLGFAEDEFMVGPFSMKKLSDDTTLPEKAPAYVSSPFNGYCYAASQPFVGLGNKEKAVYGFTK